MIDDKEEYIKDKSKKATAIYYQESLIEAINDYRLKNPRMSESKKNYVESLERNVHIAPYILGYLKWPEDEEMKRLAKRGMLTREKMEEIEKNRALEKKKPKPKRKSRKK